MSDSFPQEIRLSDENLTLRILPERGGKIASMFFHPLSFELAYQPRDGYTPLTPGMRFSDGDSSGIDDVFPSMGETYSGSLADTTLILPDHGEIWTMPMAVRSRSATEAVMTTRGRILPYDYEKRIRLESGSVRITISIRNTGTRLLPLVWIFHGLLRLEPDAFFSFPPECRMLETLGCGYPGKTKIETDVLDSRFCFLNPPPNGNMMKFYFSDPVQTGNCSVTYPVQHLRLNLTFDPKALPWLGFWITTGAYRGESNFAFEPATAWFDTWQSAESRQRLPLLSPGEKAVLRLGFTPELFS